MNEFEMMYGGEGGGLDIVKRMLLWVGWIAFGIFLIVVFVAWISSNLISSELDELEMVDGVKETDEEPVDTAAQ